MASETLGADTEGSVSTEHSNGTDVGGSTGSDAATSADATSTTSVTNDGSGSGDGSSGDGSSTGSATPIEFHTVITDDGRLALETALPPTIDACLELAPDLGCEDADEDGLTDAWEDAVLDRLRPMRRMDEDESLFDDPTAVVADVGRVAAVGDRYRLFVMLGYSRDYGSCGGFTGHNGDSERVVLDLAAWPAGGAGGVVMHGAYTAAHEGTINDHGQRFTLGELDALVIDLDPVSGEPRWVVFPSADKHATYASVDICEGVSVLPCIDEDCAPDGAADPTVFDLLPEAFNAGEEEAPRVDDLSVAGFPGDWAWADQPFCGGLGGSGCSSAVREKLLIDPFE